MSHALRPSRRLALAALLLLGGTSGCSIRGLAIKSLASALAESADVYASDGDPELVRDALPFALKTTESLIAAAPRNRQLLTSACSGFTQYAYAFIEGDAAQAEQSSYSEAERLRDRALAMYLRGRDYCLRGLELEHPGITQRLQRDPGTAAAELGGGEIDLIFWSGASWGAAISTGLHRPDIVVDLPAVRALMDRALALDEGYGQGALHEALISLDGLPAALGGSTERARQHFARAVELSHGKSAGPYLSLATSVAVPAQDRGEFEHLLGEALAIDPDALPSQRLANVLAQRRARWLLAHADDLFLDEPDAATPAPGGQ